MKNWTSLLFVAIVMLFLTAGAATAQTVTPKLILDGKVLEPTEPPQIIGNFTMVPVRIVTENLGYTVDYNKDTKQVTVNNGTSVVVMTIGKKTATVDGAEQTMLASPVAKSNTTLIPLRFTGEAFGLQVYWDNVAKSAFLYSANGSGGTTGEEPAESPPPDGGTVGVVDPDDGTGAGEAPGDNAGGSETPGGENGNGGGTVTKPSANTGTVNEVRFENEAVIFTYEGILQPRISTLTGPDRIIVDIPYSAFGPSFSPGFAADPNVQAGELVVEGHAVLQKIRYSKFSDEPPTLRFVLDLTQASGFEMTNDLTSRQLKIALTSPSVQVPSAPEKSAYTIVIDAGHGGSDPGASSITKKREKDFNLSVVLKLQALLATESRLNVVLTRSDDTYPTLADRANLANSIGADLFLSVHANSNSPSINGSETYYTRADSKAFAEAIHQYAVPAGGLKDNGLRTANYYVTRETKMPAVLYEAGYLSNASDEAQLFTEDFQNRLAQGLATAIKTYLNLA
ncbi:N-acetylmuramoyl-L-alanine amidase [Cohnella algarum]|uniref:N-acetylmuramoyl-L-alanine amidase n=1 Tax=Cohnella algarum TaxID=2044859 RepID=UPI001967BF9D|nr:N-acetylmuramoyl-L-alanine amidase [Cohnella algarum]MBN2984017.1 N-acetylmuramoyl-L-alanine amidase [Cohnella algarum]